MSAIKEDRRLEIEKVVERLFLDTGLSYPENDLLQIASGLDVNVVDAVLPDFNGKKVKGYIKWSDETEKIQDGNRIFRARIYLNANQSKSVKSFTLAHELGHFLLHQNSNKFRIDLQDYTEKGDKDNEETEANFFAGSLLMPKEKFIQAVEKAKNLDEVADVFGVSRPAVEARLKWLNLIVVE